MNWEAMPTFGALSFGDRLRVNRSLRRGEALQEPALAAAAIEWAENYQSQGRGYRALIRWLPLVVFIACGAASIFFAVDGDSLVAIANGLIALVNLAHLALNPMVRPQQVARSLEASREVALPVGSNVSRSPLGNRGTA